MHIRVTTSTNIDRWLRRFESSVGRFRAGVMAEPRKQAMIGQRLGRALAPRDTGVLINAISWKTFRDSKDSSTAMVWVRPLQNRNRSAATYAAIHHSINPSQRSMKRLPNQKKASTGDFHWMFIVREEIKRRYGKDIQGYIRGLR